MGGFMTRISKHKLDIEIEKQVFDIFWAALSQLHSAKDTAAFFSDLLSETEELMVAKRFMIALLLERGKSTVEISQILHVSYSMIGNVSRWRLKASIQTKRLLDSAQKSQDTGFLFDQIDALLDKLPPKWRTNWSRAGKEKWQRKKERISRKALR